MGRRRKRARIGFLAAATTALTAGCALGTFIAWDAIAAIDPFYRFGRADEWRPRFVNPAQGPPSEPPALAAGPVWTAPPAIPAADPYDDVRLLGSAAEVAIEPELSRLQREIEEDARRWSERLDVAIPSAPDVPVTTPVPPVLAPSPSVPPPPLVEPPPLAES